MIVAGGVYYERCVTPNVEELFGSGGRAAAALSKLTGVVLHTFFPPDEADNVVFNMTAFGVDAVVHPSDGVVEFHYNFPLSPPRIGPIPVPRAESMHVSGDVVIRFGCLEGEVIVDAKIAVYDPQSGAAPQPFGANGSKAEQLAIILNRGELLSLAHGASNEVTDDLILRVPDAPDVIVVKSGAHGARVYERGKLVGTVPAYKSAAVYKIGSGDIFTAMFAFGWATQGLSPLDAANRASMYVAHYVETRLPQMPCAPPSHEPLSPKNEKAKIYLAGSFFSSEHVWLVEEVYAALESLHVASFSPMHEVGIETGGHVAVADLAGMDECNVVLALLSDMDPGTLFEVGYAISKGLKVVAVVENPGPQDLTMISGTGCSVYTDLATAIYHAAWAAIE